MIGATKISDICYDLSINEIIYTSFQRMIVISAECLLSTNGKHVNWPENRN